MIAQKTIKLLPKLRIYSLFDLSMPSLPHTPLQLVSLSVARGRLFPVNMISQSLLPHFLEFSQVSVCSLWRFRSQRAQYHRHLNASFQQWWLWEMVTCCFSMLAPCFLLCSSVHKYLCTCTSLSCYIYSSFPSCIYIVRARSTLFFSIMYKLSRGSLRS